MRIKPIKEYEGLYEVSNSGKIFSHYALGGRHRLINKNKKREVKQRILNGFYYVVSLYKQDKGKIYRVSRLVAETFISNPNNKPQVNHKDGNKLNNNLNNLEWVTRSENIRHAFDTGLSSAKGERNSQAKLTKENILEIRELYKTGRYIHKQLAKRFNVTKNCIALIIKRKRWNHI